jgi:hypothetical protein
MTIDREQIREQLRQGLGPDTIAKGDRATHHATLEEQARIEGELGGFEPTPDNVVYLRDERQLRWEAIAVRIYGGVRDIGAVKALYDERKGAGAHRRSYTGRGRRFPDMTAQDPRHQTAPAHQEQRSERHAGVAAETAAPATRLAEVDLLRTGSVDEIHQYLEAHLHSDRFYIDSGRIWLELPNRTDAPPDKTVLVWFTIPSAYSVASPRAGSRAGRHALPRDWDATLCTISLSTWTSGIRTHAEEPVSCRWCEIRLIAIQTATETPLSRYTAPER